MCFVGEVRHAVAMSHLFPAQNTVWGPQRCDHRKKRIFGLIREHGRFSNDSGALSAPSGRWIIPEKVNH